MADFFNNYFFNTAFGFELPYCLPEDIPQQVSNPGFTNVWEQYAQFEQNGSNLNVEWNNYNFDSFNQGDCFGAWDGGWTQYQNAQSYYSPTYNKNATPLYQQSSFWEVTAPEKTEAFNPKVYKASIKEAADNIEVDNYNKHNGMKLAQTARDGATGSSHCARHVRLALDKSGVLTDAELNQVESKYNLSHGHAYQWMSILRKLPEKFKEIPVTDTNYKHLPAGAIMVYDKWASGYNKDSGHIQIATGDGKAAHFCIQNTLKKPTAIFIPV